MKIMSFEANLRTLQSWLLEKPPTGKAISKIIALSEARPEVISFNATSIYFGDCA